MYSVLELSISFKRNYFFIIKFDFLFRTFVKKEAGSG